MRALFLINPNAGRAEAALRQLEPWLKEQKGVKLIETKGHHAMKTALKDEGPKAERIVIGGGDGTISAALPALLKLDKPVAILPLGTANDFARTLCVPDRPLLAAELALSGREHRIDVGLANGTPFLNVASIGVASRVTKAQSKDRKRFWSKLSYAISLREVIREVKHPLYVWITVDRKSHWKGMVHQVSVGNGRFHGGGLIVAEDASIDDGKLNIYVVRPGTVLQLVACLTTLRFGFSGETEALKRISGQEVLIRTSRPQAVDVDGDLRTETPAEFTIRQRALTVIIPQELPRSQRGLSAVTEES
jgi:diacylglycerol kinase (ATP)